MATIYDHEPVDDYPDYDFDAELVWNTVLEIRLFRGDREVGHRQIVASDPESMYTEAHEAAARLAEIAEEED